MTFLLDRPGVLADQEIKIRAAVRLHDVVHVPPGVPASAVGKPRFPAVPSPRQFTLGNHQIEFVLIGVEPDGSPVETSERGSLASDSGETCRTTVPNAVPDILASDTRTMSLTPSCASRFGIGMLPTSGSPDRVYICGQSRTFEPECKDCMLATDANPNRGIRLGWR